MALDRGDEGLAEAWQATSLEGAVIRLPGCLAEQGLGDAVTLETPWTASFFDKKWFSDARYAPYREPGKVKVPYFLQPETYFAGAAWYQREIELPGAPAGTEWTLFLERSHWETRVWLDDVELGADRSLSAPHVYRLPADCAAGEHRLTLRVDNTRLLVDLGENSHSISDHTQGNWNGLIGRLELRAAPVCRVVALDPFPDALAGTVRVRGEVQGEARNVALRVRAQDEARVWAAARAPVEAGGRFAATLELGPEAPRWDEFSPALLELEAVPEGESGAVAGSAAMRRTFGLRTIVRDGRQLRLNGRPVFLRGTLDCAIFPETGYPPMTEAPWRRVLETIRAHGLNHVRFHSWCPPEAAFAVADELGIYFQIEVASWPMWSTKLGEGRSVDAWIEAETGRILATYGHHPSFLFLAAGNEPDGQGHEDWLGAWVERWRERDGRRLYTTAAGWPMRPESDFHVEWHARIQHWGAGLDSPINAAPPRSDFDFAEIIGATDAPYVSHEIGQWCAFPDLAETARYTGYLKARNFEIFADRLEDLGLRHLAPAFLHASGRLQALCYKADIEAALRTPAMAGFQLLGLQDFPGQGTALVGVLNAFWESKGYIEAEEFRAFAGPTVPLARLPKHVFTADETLTVPIEVAHWGAREARAVEAAWQLRSNEGAVLAQGTLASRDLPVGGPTPLGKISCPLGDLPAPTALRLEVELPAL
ncbi:MAG: hypothetical protein ACLFU2_09590, partial [Opitutales bacterium]